MTETQRTHHFRITKSTETEFIFHSPNSQTRSLNAMTNSDAFKTTRIVCMRWVAAIVILVSLICFFLSFQLINLFAFNLIKPDESWRNEGERLALWERIEQKRETDESIDSEYPHFERNFRCRLSFGECQWIIKSNDKIAHLNAKCIWKENEKKE